MIQGSCSECIWCKGLLEAKKPDVVRICDGMVLTNREDNENGCAGSDC